MRIALVSLEPVWERKKESRVRCASFINRAQEDRVDLVVLPEMTLTGFSMHMDRIAETSDHLESVYWFQQQARSAQVALIAGYVEQSPQGRGLNSAVFIDGKRGGEILCSYVKVHPFSMSAEDVHCENGEHLGICTWQSVSFGLSICYDLRFPELYRAMSRSCEVLVNIASWPTRRSLHWYTLLRARAIENQVFMIGVNRYGTDPAGNEHELSSIIYDPLGEQVPAVISDGCYQVCEIDVTEVGRTRKEFPVMEDRKDALYAQWYK